MAITCGIENISQLAGCRKGGVTDLFLAKSSDIDLTDTLANYTESNQTISTIVMNSPAVFKRWQFDPREATLVATRAEGDSTYDVVLTLQLQGKSGTKTAAIIKAAECCDLVAVVKMASGEFRLFGLEVNDTSTQELNVSRVMPARVDGHTDDSGNLTGNSLDTVIIRAMQFRPPLYVTNAPTV